MKNYRLTVSYDGTRYLGWQRQGGAPAGRQERTIQGKLEAVLSKMTGEEITVNGSGRTDSGVHALAQTANFKTDFVTSPEDVKAYLNRYLPGDIAVTAVEEAPERFHARLHATAKTYRYRINNSAVPRVFSHRYEYQLARPLDIEAMRAGAALLCGTHDFRNFCSSKRVKKSTVRTIYSIAVEKDGDIIDLTFRGNGFLYNMVRIMVGTLIQIGLGERPPESIPAIFAAQARAEAGYTAPPHGLTLISVEY